jgi:hypothetical protein
MLPALHPVRRHDVWKTSDAKFSKELSPNCALICVKYGGVFAVADMIALLLLLPLAVMGEQHGGPSSNVVTQESQSQPSALQTIQRLIQVSQHAPPSRHHPVDSIGAHDASRRLLAVLI